MLLHGGKVYGDFKSAEGVRTPRIWLAQRNDMELSAAAAAVQLLSLSSVFIPCKTQTAGSMCSVDLK